MRREGIARRGPCMGFRRAVRVGRGQCASVGFTAATGALVVVLAFLMSIWGGALPASGGSARGGVAGTSPSFPATGEVGPVAAPRDYLNPDPLLAYGVNVLAEGVTYASLVPGLLYTNASSGPCPNPAPRDDLPSPVVLSAAATGVICLNSADDGNISSSWQSNLTNATTFLNGSTPVRGCAPTSDAAGCAFFGSNRYTQYVSAWKAGVPENSSVLWMPNLTGYAPSDIVVYATLGFNASVPSGTVYSVTVNFTGATPVPMTYYVRTPGAGWTGGGNLTVAFDADLAWYTELSVPTNGTPGIAVGVGAEKIRVACASPCPDYSVAFEATGLPTGSHWQVSVDGATQYSATGTVVFTEPNGTYPFVVDGPRGWRVSAPTGALVVHGLDLQQSLTFAAGATTKLTFAEVGLEKGSEWCVTVGAPTCSNSRTVVFPALTPGAYPYSVAPVSSTTTLLKVGRAWTVAASGTVSVGTRSTTVHVRFAYEVAFVETGLPSGTLWKVTVGGEKGSTTGTTVDFFLTNGTYRFLVHRVTGYVRSPASGHVAVTGAPVVEPIAFSSTSGGGSGPYALGMSVGSEFGSTSTWVEVLSLAPTAGLETSYFGMKVVNPESALYPTVAPSGTGCSVASASNPPAACTGTAGGWYGVLVSPSTGDIVAIYGGASAGWSYVSGTTVALNNGYSLWIITPVSIAGDGYVLSVYSVGTASVVGSVNL
jgi:hypothetical protein